MDPARAVDLLIAYLWEHHHDIAQPIKTVETVNLPLRSPCLTGVHREARHDRGYLAEAFWHLNQADPSEVGILGIDSDRLLFRPLPKLKRVDYAVA
jgi:hypothetical protein